MLLAMDTSTQWVGLALYDGAQVLGEITWQTHSHHTMEMAPAIQDLLQRCGVRSDMLKALGVALGPGSFTSLRIGLALAKGLSLSLHIPVVGLPTLDILAAAQPVQDLPLIALLQAGRGRLAVGHYKPGRGRWKPQDEAVLQTLDQLVESINDQPALVCGELDAAARQTLSRQCKSAVLASPARSLRRPAVLAELAWQRWQTDKVDDVVSLAPIYLRVADPIPG